MSSSFLEEGGGGSSDTTNEDASKPSTRMTVCNFIDALLRLPPPSATPHNHKHYAYSDSRTTVLTTADGTQYSTSVDAYLADRVEVLHPLLLVEPPATTAKAQTTSPTEAPPRPASSNLDNNDNNHNLITASHRLTTLEEQLQLLRKQEKRTTWFSLEPSLTHEHQITRVGYSHLKGIMRGEIVQTFTLHPRTLRITHITVHKTTAPWRDRWWWYRRRSFSVRRLLWRAWWEDWEMSDEQRAADELAFQQRLLETNFFAF